MQKVRLQKFLSNSGVVSRRKAEKLITDGKVIVNGEIAKTGDKVDPCIDKVKVNNKVVKEESKKIYLALNKPRGYVTTLKDEFSRKCVANLIENINSRVFPVGRLDKDSEGLLLLTNDGNFANFIMHPSYMVKKVYIVVVTPLVTSSVLSKLRSGVVFKEEKLELLSVTVISQNEDSNASTLRIVLNEGKKRHIRKMCTAVNLDVISLKRISVGPVELRNLKPGKYRHLAGKELELLQKSILKKCYLNGSIQSCKF